MNALVATISGCSVQFCFLLGRFLHDEGWVEMVRKEREGKKLVEGAGSETMVSGWGGTLLWTWDALSLCPSSPPGVKSKRKQESCQGLGIP